MSETIDANKTYCLHCKSQELIYTREASGWAFFEECTKCHHKHYWSSNDMQGGAFHMHTLISHGENWMPEYYISAITNLIEKWEMANYPNKEDTGIWKDYHRRLHVANQIRLNIDDLQKIINTK